MKFIWIQDFLDMNFSALSNITPDSLLEVNKRRALSIYVAIGVWVKTIYSDQPVDINTKSFSERMDDLLDIEKSKLLEAA